MPIMSLTDDVIEAFRQHLYSDEKSPFTIDKYIRDTKAFARFLGGRPLAKERTLEYKAALMESGKFADSSINSMLSSLRALFRFLDRPECAVSGIRIQEMLFCPEDKSLYLAEYQHLLDAAGTDRRLCLLLQVLFCTGIRISELQYFTVEEFGEIIDKTRVMVHCKNKNRRVLVAESWATNSER